jgi:adenylate kinase family enzyme
MQFPIFKTKIKGLARKFNLADPRERQKYFELKAGPEIKKLRNYQNRGKTFIAYLLGKKNSGKGTYAKLFIEAVGGPIAHISIGDVVRRAHREMLDKTKKKEWLNFLKQNYRGYISVEQAVKALLHRDTKTLLPTEFILALVKKDISRLPRTSLFIDGFPRDMDQISYSLFFRDLINYRHDPDIFVLIDVPLCVIDERIKFRRVCPKCQTPRNLKLLPTLKIGFDKKKKEFYLVCDNPGCKGARMLAKEGDSLGIKPIGARLKMDEKLIKQAFSLFGIPKILLRNSVPKNLAKQYIDDYEITPQYSYKWDAKTRKVKVIEKPWLVKDNQGKPCYSLMAPPVAVSLIKQMAKILH